MKLLRRQRLVASCRSNVPSSGPRVIGSSPFLPLLSAAVLLATANPPSAVAKLDGLAKDRPSEESALVQKLLKSSKENKEKYDDERLQSYYKKNFKEYFEYEAGDEGVAKARGISPETLQSIQQWLQKNQ